MSVLVRAVTPDDHDVWCALWDKYLAFYETSRDGEVKQATWARILDPAVPMHAQLAVDDDGSVLGLVNYLFHPTFWEKTDTCYLNDLFVMPEARGTGAGAALVQAVVTAAKAAGIGGVYWLTAENNERARRLYDAIAQKTPFVHYVVGNA